MIKVVLLLRRKPSMSVEDFISYYETSHAPLSIKYLPGIIGYRRLFVNPGPPPFGHAPRELDFDVVTELTFENKEAYESAVAAFTDEDLAKIFMDDEKNLFDVSAPHRAFFATEHVSHIG